MPLLPRATDGFPSIVTDTLVDSVPTSSSSAALDNSLTSSSSTPLDSLASATLTPSSTDALSTDSSFTSSTPTPTDTTDTINTTAVATTTSIPTSTGTSVSDSTNASKASTSGMKLFAGIFISVVGLAILGGVLYFILRRRKRRLNVRQSSYNSTPQDENEAQNGGRPRYFAEPKEDGRDDAVYDPWRLQDSPEEKAALAKSGQGTYELGRGRSTKSSVGGNYTSLGLSSESSTAPDGSSSQRPLLATLSPSSSYHYQFASEGRLPSERRGIRPSIAASEAARHARQISLLEDGSRYPSIGVGRAAKNPSPHRPAQSLEAYVDPFADAGAGSQTQEVERSISNSGETRPKPGWI
ncbi:hypothetical protein FRB95_013885 [Tulasnella sp. JGI-2019a]|nr:hypothetical protein FRB93_001621 [Tulasnella sp. JGI-2019a]KAG9034014.1 hypothetical protein FRB95_013885 [Tulasnella sp. JGI-2019a]